jgi:glycosyltransferase involved in cell wall biosynthesis
VSPERVEVIPLAADASFRPLDEEAARAAVRRRVLGADVPFLLFVGKLSGRHLIPELIEAFARARAGPETPARLVLVGPNVLGLDIAACARAHGVEPFVTHLPHVAEAELPGLYASAEAFVYPATDAEGFGLPLVEAMACGAPVLSTALGSVPEVVQDAALLVPDNAPGTWAQALRRLAPEPALREDLRRRGRTRALAFSWRRTAERTMEVLRQAAVETAPARPRLQ